MPGRWWMVCAAAGLLGLGGCFVTRPFGQPAAPEWQQWVLEGRPADLAPRLQNGLHLVGLEVALAPQGQAVRMVGKAHSGRPFSVLLMPERPEDGERTVVRLLWQRAADPDTTARVESAVASLGGLVPAGP